MYKQAFNIKNHNGKLSVLEVRNGSMLKNHENLDEHGYFSSFVRTVWKFWMSCGNAFKNLLWQRVSWENSSFYPFSLLLNVPHHQEAVQIRYFQKRDWRIVNRGFDKLWGLFLGISWYACVWLWKLDANLWCCTIIVAFRVHNWVCIHIYSDIMCGHSELVD